MVQPNTEARPRRARTRRGEEQAPLVESQLSVPNEVIMDGEEVTPGTQAGFLSRSLNSCPPHLLQASMAQRLSWAQKSPIWT